MKEDQLTPWFPAEVKPVHVGVYRTKMSFMGPPVGGFSYWDGRKWGYQGDTKRDAHKWRGFNGDQKKTWRGLRSKP